MQEAEALARKSEAEVRSERAERSELVQQKLRGAREQVEQLRKQGNHEAAEKLMKEAEAMARKFEVESLYSLRADQRERVEQKLRTARERVDQLRAQGDQRQSPSRTALPLASTAHPPRPLR